MKNQSGSVFVSVTLFMITLAIVINLTVDFFRYNASIQELTERKQDRNFLKKDLESQARIGTSIRRSLNDPNNPTFKACVLSGCVQPTPREFWLASPMSPLPGKPDLPIAGPIGSPARYSSFGEACATPGPGCDNLAYSFYNADGTNLNVWVVLAPSRSSGVPPLDISRPTAVFPIATILRTY
ncbi:MAG: hypothetical protein A4S09_08700 [Proteobacteria bacterium SG_bin7]|nr:MAG: hypothetical protein A4S09_08700 [Proteobacteria bacterium SG_bin7]